jgi:hypothetical protein
MVQPTRRDHDTYHAGGARRSTIGENVAAASRASDGYPWIPFRQPDIWSSRFPLAFSGVFDYAMKVKVQFGT